MLDNVVALSSNSTIVKLGIVSISIVGLAVYMQRLRSLTRHLKTDKFQYLEEIASETNLQWVKEQNKLTLQKLGEPSEKEIYKKILNALDSKDKIPYVTFRKPYYYNFWKDEVKVDGIWRRLKNLGDIKDPQAQWETVLDMDELNKKENARFVFKGVVALDEGEDCDVERVLVKLSPGGSDAVEIREFDLKKKQFISANDGGFFLPEAKTSVSYKHKDLLLVGTKVGSEEESLTKSGYPRQVRELKRNGTLETSPVVFEVDKEDVSGSSWIDAFYKDKKKTEYEWRCRAKTFYVSEYWVRKKSAEETSGGNAFVKIDVDEMSELSVAFNNAQELLISLKQDWNGYKTGSLLMTPIDDVIQHGGKIQKDKISVVFEPTKERTLEYFVKGKTILLLSIMNVVKSELIVCEKEAGKVKLTPLANSINIGEKVDVYSFAEDESDAFWMIKTGYVLPTTLFHLDSYNKGEFTITQTIRSLPSFFKTNHSVSQRFAKSKDGTEVPYFVVSPLGEAKKRKTLLYGYGGFEISLLPSYSVVNGIGLIERGFNFVVANIRGGGEFGPMWHQAALKEKRNKAFEDFEAVAAHLIDTGMCDWKGLAIQGGSNGGLLVGNMFVRQLKRKERKLFNAVVCEVPLLDMMRYHLLLAGNSWVAEYGSFDVEEDRKHLLEYSPYEQIDLATFKNAEEEEFISNILLMTSTKDDRVSPAHARKMVAKLMERKETMHKTFYFENIEGGHAGASNNKQVANMETIAFLFLDKVLKD